MAEKKNWLKKRIEWLENNRISGSIILTAFCFGILGGILNFAEESVKLWKVFKEDETENRIQVEVQNARSNSVEIVPVCHFEVIETGRNSTAFYFGLGDSVRLSPVGSFSGTDAYILKAGETRAYRIRLPNNQVARDLMDRGATKIQLSVENLEGGQAMGEIAFQKEIIRKQKAVVKFVP